MKIQADVIEDRILVKAGLKLTIRKDIFELLVQPNAELEEKVLVEILSFWIKRRNAERMKDQRGEVDI